jgi:hypothetical protein
MRLWPSGGRDLFPSSARVLALLCTLVTPAVPYMFTGLVGCLVDPRISCGARKLVRTSWIKKKLINILVYLHGMKEQDRAISWNLPGKGTKLFINFAWFQAYHSKHVFTSYVYHVRGDNLFNKQGIWFSFWWNEKINKNIEPW